MERVTLMFDNAPTPGLTEHALNILVARRIYAKYFVLGNKFAGPRGW